MVDDDQDLTTLDEAVLKLQGYLVIVSNNGEKALQARPGHQDVIL